MKKRNEESRIYGHHSGLGFLSVFLLGVALAAFVFLVVVKNNGSVLTNTGPTITGLEKLGHLCFLKINIADVLSVHDDGFLGDIKGLWLVKGDALVAVDMRRAEICDKDTERRTATVVLPAPDLLSPRIDHNRTRSYDWQVGWLRSYDDSRQIWNDAMSTAQQLVTQAATKEMKREFAIVRTHATKLIKTCYESVGWTIRVVWEDDKHWKAPKTHDELNHGQTIKGYSKHSLM